jgi:hypothetical protein
MSSPTSTIHKTFESLQRSISLEHRHTFESTELQDVWTAIQDIQTAQRKRRSAQNLRRIEPLLEALEKYAKVIEILCNGTQYLSFIWVSHYAILRHLADEELTDPRLLSSLCCKSVDASASPFALQSTILIQ